jgi:hypothetical protein
MELRDGPLLAGIIVKSSSIGHANRGLWTIKEIFVCLLGWSIAVESWMVTPPDCWEGPYLTLQNRTDLYPRYTCGLGCESGTYDW